jgi:crotonobetainyl-CoA:carnitine CoA-transferase CaiB-like acyl-CoA transferase
MPTSAYKTADGYINVACSGDGMWKRLCNVIGREDLLALSEFKSNELRSQNRGRLNEVLNGCFLSQDSKTWIDLLNKAGVPCGPIYCMNEVFADPQVKHLGAVAEAKHPRLGKLNLLAQVVKLTRTPASIATATPEIGEHTEEILRELEYSQSEISDLKKKGAI